MNGANVLILGCGPSGLLAAHAVERMGGSPGIISRKVKSELPGAQYLHEPIPDLHDSREPDGVIKTIRRGTPEGYAQKVYGRPTAPTSWETVRPEVPAWDLRATYDLLWERYQSRIVDSEVTPEDLDEFPKWFKLVISTIWAPHTCQCFRGWLSEPDFHLFESESMYVVDWAPLEVEDNTVLYSGESEFEWYRCSRVFGHASSEGTHHSMKQPVGYGPAGGIGKVIPLKKGIKVVGSNCDCRPKIKRAGRYGTWRKGYLTHHAFADATGYYNEAFAS